MDFNKEEFNALAVKGYNVVGVFPEEKVLKSKRRSNWYVNWRNATEDAYGVDALSDFVLDFVEDKGWKPDCFFGVPEGATKLGIITQFKWAADRDGTELNFGSHVLPMGRGKPKSHGDPKDRYFLGEPKGNVVVLEDVTTTGGSLLETVANVRSLDGVSGISAIGLTNRMELTPIPGKDDLGVVNNFAQIYRVATGSDYTKAMSVEESLKQADVGYLALSTGPELLAQVEMSDEMREAIEREFREYGINEVSLK